MRRSNTKRAVLVVLTSLALAIGGWGCGNDEGGTDPDLVGTWQGTLVGGDGTVWTFSISDTLVTARSETQEVYTGQWFASTQSSPSQASFVVTGCSIDRYVGQSSLVIYDIQGDHLTLVSNEPGDPTRPTSFEPHENVRVWTLTKQ